eukprot:CAMPEP_0119115794 /NCGR_PEP_ID=MMETSP1180-20130426/51935_1 /TAXON_ID=3052 ORGANISM="Chlamydomonas cf sp, Strain CCMP681" /NCGR_SAMPLE_ID=MMETSP1180 /ASSEMBLY_ACC=CAM_ASM_000741 /LENGTH=65 /DNA_ID=CAMNT_0007104887 /DNA_START=997 /DNA_END=1191 /DNA_ORIENTATION=-
MGGMPLVTPGAGCAGAAVPCDVQLAVAIASRGKHRADAWAACCQEWPKCCRNSIMPILAMAATLH